MSHLHTHIGFLNWDDVLSIRVYVVPWHLINIDIRWLILRRSLKSQKQCASRKGNDARVSSQIISRNAGLAKGLCQPLLVGNWARGCWSDVSGPLANGTVYMKLDIVLGIIFWPFWKVFTALALVCCIGLWQLWLPFWCLGMVMHVKWAKFLAATNKAHS